MAAALPALAQDSNADALSRYQFQRSLQAAFAAPVLTASPSLAVAAADVEVDPEPIMGKPGDAASWRTTEFNSDWGLQAINADVAYARGLTGTGIRLGVFDSGTGLDHDEFAGKDHRSIHLADVLADGSLCAREVLSGPDACFASDGDQVAVSYQLLDPDYADLLERNGFYEGLSYNVHGTHVSGTIAANRDGHGTHGVAFGADLSVARLFSNSATYLSVVNIGGSLYLDEQTIAAIQADDSIYPQLYAQMNEQGVRAINHSWGLANEPTTAEDLDVPVAPGVRRQSGCDGRRFAQQRPDPGMGRWQHRFAQHFAGRSADCRHVCLAAARRRRRRAVLAGRGQRQSGPGAEQPLDALWPGGELVPRRARLEHQLDRVRSRFGDRR
jgi:subtilase-type serine protease